MLLETVNKTAPEAMALPDNLVLICRFEGRNHVICSLYMIREICVFCQDMIRENCNYNREIPITSC